MSIGSPIILIPSRKRYLVLHEIGATLRRGYPLKATLENLSGRIRKFRSNYKRLISQLNQGVSFSESAKNCRQLFPARFQPYLDHGEKNKQLPLMFTLLEGDYQRERVLYQAWRNSLLYPILLILILANLSFLSYMKIIPLFEELFADFGIGRMYSGYGFWGSLARWWLFNYFHLFVGLFVLVVAGIIIVTKLSGNLGIHRLHEKMPLLGKAFYYRFWSKFIRTLGILLKEGVSMADAIAAARDVMGREFITEACARLIGKVTEGQSLSASLRADRVFPESLVWTAAQGEFSGKLPEHLLNQAENFEKVGMLMTERGLRVVEALLITIVAAFAVMFVISIYLALFGLATSSI